MKKYSIKTLKSSVSFWEKRVKFDIIDELEKLRGVAEAAAEGHEHPPAPTCRLCDALKAWREK
jgi:hypothetical protein